MRNTSSFLDAQILSQSTNQARRGSRRRAPDHLIDVVSPRQSLLRWRGQKQRRKTGRREPTQRHNQAPRAKKARSALEGSALYPHCLRFEESREAFFHYLWIGVLRTGGKPFYFYRKASILSRWAISQESPGETGQRTKDRSMNELFQPLQLGDHALDHTEPALPERGVVGIKTEGRQ